MKICVIAVSKNKTDYDELFQEYIKRIKRYFDYEDKIIKHSNLKEESEMIFSKLKGNDYVVLLEKDGSNLKSEEFANFLDHRIQDAQARIVFIIGGAYGVDEIIRKRANYILSLGSMTLPHNLCKLILLEQIYRAFSILNNEPYHH